MTLNRNRIVRLAAVFVAICAGSQGARAAQVMYEGFNYPTGKLAGDTNLTAPANSNGATNTNVWTRTGGTNDPDVVTGNLSYAGFPTGSGAMAKLTGTGGANQTADRIATQDFHAGDTIYFSMLVQVPAGAASMGTSTTTGSFFTGFNYFPDSLGTMSSTSVSSAAPLCVRVSPNDSTAYQLGIAYRDAPAASTRQFAPVDLHAGETHLLVGKYVINPGNQDDAAYLFIDPDLSSGLEPASASISSINTAGSGTFDFFYNAADGTQQLETTIRSFILRSNGVEPSNMNVDELRIGSNWTDVTTAAVPEPASLSLLALGAVAGLTRRRRRVC
jgi:hypothetical protein